MANVLCCREALQQVGEKPFFFSNLMCLELRQRREPRQRTPCWCRELSEANPLPDMTNWKCCVAYGHRIILKRQYSWEKQGSAKDVCFPFSLFQLTTKRAGPCI